MAKSKQKTKKEETCLIAAEQVQRKLMALARRINRSQDPRIAPKNPLPVDIFLEEMSKRKNTPRVVFEPVRLKDKIWTESITAYLYAQIERAFVKAGRLQGGQRSGHTRELRKLRAWLVQQERDPGRPVPLHFVHKTSLLFSKGILDDRRRARIQTISNIGYSTPCEQTDLAQLKKWIDEDLADSRLRSKGRPPDYQKIVFAAEMANLWNDLTGRPISKGPETNFARFLIACWESGFVGVDMNSNFKRIIRHHIEECDEVYSCGRCKGCRNSERCERIRYFGILI